MKHGDISWTNDYGNSGVYISLSVFHVPEGGYIGDIESKHTLFAHWGIIGKIGKSGKKRYVELHQESEGTINPYKAIVYKDTWYVRGNLANRNISATGLSYKEAVNLCYKILDIATKDDTICQVTIIDELEEVDRLFNSFLNGKSLI